MLSIFIAGLWGKKKLFHDTKMILTKQFKQIKQLTQNGQRSVFIL